MKEELTVHDIINWVIANKQNQDDIDMLSHLIFPYTTKYKSQFGGSYQQRYSQDDDINVVS